MQQMKALPIVFLCVVVIGCATHTNTFVVVNNASVGISRMSVAICGQQFELKGLKPNQKASRRFTADCEGHYDIKVEFETGKVLQSQTGYVTTGMDFEDTISVRDAEIERIARHDVR